MCCDFLHFLKGQGKKTTDISLQVSTPLNNQQEGGSCSSKGRSFLTKQGSQATNPIPQHPKNENAYTAASPVLDRTQLLPNNRGTAVQLSAFPQQPARETHPQVLKPASSLHRTLQRESCFETFLIFIAHLHEHSALPVAQLMETACPVLCQVIVTTRHGS